MAKKPIGNISIGVTTSTTSSQQAEPILNGSSFSLIGDPSTAQLAMNGQVVTTVTLKEMGYSVTKSPVSGGEPCNNCAPQGSRIMRTWMCVSIFQNNIPGKLWVCSNCSKATEHKRGGQELWRALLKNSR